MDNIMPLSELTDDPKPFYTSRARLASELVKNGFPIVNTAVVFDRKRWFFNQDDRMFPVIETYYNKIGKDVPVSIRELFDGRLTFADGWSIQCDRLRQAREETNRHRAAAIMDKFGEFCWIDYRCEDGIDSEMKWKIHVLAKLSDNIIALLDAGKDAAKLFDRAVSMADDIAGKL